MRVRALLLTLVLPACAAGITACGGTAAPRRVPQVRLQLRSPSDGTRVQSASVTVSGVVTPARSEVLVSGHPAAVGRHGAFSTQVRLSTGMNLIDVLASLPDASGAMSALRVERYVLVAVPQVNGDAPNDAEAALRDAGLVPSVQPSSDPLSFLVPLPEKVCSTSPAPGSRVAPGSTVTLATGKFC